MVAHHQIKTWTTTLFLWTTFAAFALAQNLKWQATLPTVVVSTEPEFGKAIPVEDLDSDGLDDYVIANPQADLFSGSVVTSGVGRLRAYSSANKKILWDRIGLTTTRNFGLFAASIGDQNADGIADIACVSTTSSAQGEAEQKKVILVSGADGSLLNEFALSDFITCLENAGDRDSDGLPDLLLGGYLINGTTYPGTIRIVSPLNGILINSWVVADPIFAVCSLDDWDGDGTREMVYGAPYSPFPFNNQGVVSVLSGATANTIFTVQGLLPDTYLAGNVHECGDMNGDGAGDLLVTGLQLGTPGIARVFASPVGMELLMFDLLPKDVNYSTTITVGDVNLDGIPDFEQTAFHSGLSLVPNLLARVSSGVPNTILGAISDSTLTSPTSGRSNRLGDIDLDGISDVIIFDELNRNITVAGTASGSILKKSHITYFATFPTSTLGDVNGDGIRDIGIGSPYTDANSEILVGQTEIRSGVDAGLIYSLIGTQPEQQLGTRFCQLGDLDSDSKDDYGVWDGQSVVAIYSGASGSKIFSIANLENLITVGDVNLDGIPDLGGSNPATGSTALGFYGVVEMFSGVNGNSIWRIQNNDGSGRKLLSYGDVNSDGVNDLMYSRQLVKQVTSASGVDGAPIFHVNWTTPSDFGTSLEKVGDVDYDGILDVAVGGDALLMFAFPSTFVSIPGDVTIVSGKTGTLLGLISGPTIPMVNDSFGKSIVNVGDINLDGLCDLAITSHFDFILGTAVPGIVKVVSGANAGLLFQINAPAGENVFGLSLAAIGDVTLDGIPDIAINGVSGGPGTIGSGLFSGSGGLQALSIPANGEMFGMGDIDQDGMSELLINSKCYSLLPAGQSIYGQGWGGCFGEQFMAANSPARSFNSNFTFLGSKAPPSSPGVAIITDVKDAVGTFLFGLGIPFYVDLVNANEVATVDMFSDSSGFAVGPAPLTDLSQIIGKTYYVQTIWYWPSSVWGTCSNPPIGLSASRGYAITIQ